MDTIISQIFEKTKMYDYIIIHSDILYLIKEYGIEETKNYFMNYLMNL